MRLTHLSLFSGIGGLDLAAEWAGFETVGQCEWAEYPRRVLEKHWPGIPRWKDIRTLTGEDYYARTGRRTVDVISGGFPCQPFSTAGKRRGKEDDRYLWPEMVRVIAELRPTWVVGENVAGIINMALDTVLSDLGSQGYAARTFLIPASGVGAPHQRYRTAIVAYADGGRQLHRESEINTAEARKSAQCQYIGCSEDVADPESDTAGGLSVREEAALSGFGSGNKYVQHANRAGCPKQHIPAKPSKKRYVGRGCDEDECAGGPPEYTGWEWWSVEPGVGRVANGIPDRVDRLRCLGNAVVPQQFYPVFRAIADTYDNKTTI